MVLPACCRLDCLFATVSPARESEWILTGLFYKYKTNHLLLDDEELEEKNISANLGEKISSGAKTDEVSDVLTILQSEIKPDYNTSPFFSPTHNSFDS